LSVAKVKLILPHYAEMAMGWLLAASFLLAFKMNLELLLFRGMKK